MALNKIYPKSESVCVLLAAQGSARVLSIDLFSLITGFKLFLAFVGVFITGAKTCELLLTSDCTEPNKFYRF